MSFQPGQFGACSVLSVQLYVCLSSSWLSGLSSSCFSSFPVVSFWLLPCSLFSVLMAINNTLNLKYWQSWIYHATQIFHGLVFGKGLPKPNFLVKTWIGSWISVLMNSLTCSFCLLSRIYSFLATDATSSSTVDAHESVVFIVCQWKLCHRNATEFCNIIRRNILIVFPPLATWTGKVHVTRVFYAF